MHPPRHRLATPLARLATLAMPLALLVAPRPSPGQEAGTALDRLTDDVTFLADDAQGGRAPGSSGIERAADYIADAFEDAGLAPAPGLDGYYQPFTIAGSPRLGGSQDLAAHVPDGEPIDGRLRRDFMPLSIGAGGSAEGLPIAFVGYGITTEEGADPSYDDYQGIDVEGKAVILLRRAPGYEEPDGLFSGDGHLPPREATFQHKATNAFRHGAKLVILVNDEAGLDGEEDELLLFTSAGSERYTTIPFVMAHRAWVDKLLKAADAPSLSELEAKITGGDMPKKTTSFRNEYKKPLVLKDDGVGALAFEFNFTVGATVGAAPKPSSFVLNGVTLDARIDVEQPDIEARNVVGVLEGAGPLADETVVVGAHFDHLGSGGMGSLSPFSRDIHNGADDNASGTAMLLELARRLSSRPDPLPRRVVFIAFSAEERGLLGSRHYVEESPLFPIDRTVAMVNFDMVGRLNDEDQLTVFGVDTTPGLRELVTAVGTSYGLSIRANAQVAGNSDHASFHEKGIPIAFLFTGTHRDYHRPSDDIDKINFDGMSRIADFAEVLLLDFARRPERPAFVQSEEPEPQPRVAGSSASLGTIPDYDDSIKGVRLNGVREGSAAEKAGLKGGDVIVGYGGRPVGTIYDFMEGLSGSKPGDSVKIEVRRGEETVTLEAVLDAAAPREGHDD